MVWCLQVYVVGDVGIQEELDLAGYDHFGGPEDGGKVVELKPGFALPHDHNVRATQPQALWPIQCAYAKGLRAGCRAGKLCVREGGMSAHEG